jgi:hypothetical protein
MENEMQNLDDNKPSKTGGSKKPVRTMLKEILKEGVERSTGQG